MVQHGFSSIHTLYSTDVLASDNTVISPEKIPSTSWCFFQGELARSVRQTAAPPLQLLLELSVLPILSIFSGPSFACLGSLPTGVIQTINPEQYQSLFTMLVKPWLLLWCIAIKTRKGISKRCPIFHLGAKQFLPWPQYPESIAPVRRRTKAYVDPM